MSCHPGRYCATTMNYAAIKPAEQWTWGSVAMALLLVLLIGLWYFRAWHRR
jgi:hypothetical protein